MPPNFDNPQYLNPKLGVNNDEFKYENKHEHGVEENAYELPGHGNEMVAWPDHRQQALRVRAKA